MDKKQLAALRRGVTPKLRQFILGDGNGCDYCGFPAVEVDHIVPVSRGGGMALSNLAPACYECNHEKLDQTVAEWAQSRIADGKPWPIPGFCERVANYLATNGITPEVVGDDARAWIESLPNGYQSLRQELVAARDREVVTVNA
jgi:hypothetical protein